MARICEIFATENVARWTGAFVVATDHKLRVRLPNGT
jgi:hypothetical protein